MSRLFSNLVELASPPFDAAAIDAADVRHFGTGQPVRVEDLRAFFASARLLAPTDPSIDGWSYAPWLDGTLSAAGRTYAVRIFLGGRAKLGLPSGGDVMLDGDATLLAL